MYVVLTILGEAVLCVAEQMLLQLYTYDPQLRSLFNIKSKFHKYTNTVVLADLRDYESYKIQLFHYWLAKFKGEHTKWNFHVGHYLNQPQVLECH